MNKEESDKMLIEIHGDVKVIRQTGENHGLTLYGPDGNSGVTKDVTILQERQDQCPARRANSVGAKRLSVATAMLILAVISIMASVAFGIWGMK